jgi:hypothetical protein
MFLFWQHKFGDPPKKKFNSNLKGMLYYEKWFANKNIFFCIAAIAIAP